MADHVAQRTLVKSPPELWAEVSEQRTLANRLEAFGEIRITRLEPETTVAWEGKDVRGTVELEPAGWGTVVTLRAEPAAERQEAEPAAAEEQEATAPDAPKRPGFFARMFRRRRRTAPAPAAPAEEQPAPDPLRLDTQEPEAAPEPIEQLLTAVLDDLGSAHHRPFSRG